LKTKKYFILVLILLLTVCVFADTITLKSGTECKGKITGYDKDNIYLKINDNQRVLIDKTLIGSMNSEKYTASILFPNKSSYPRDYSKYTKPADLEAYLESKNQLNQVSELENELASKEPLNFSSSYTKGIMDAKRWHNPDKWLWGGLATGAFIPILGTALITLNVSETYTDTIPQNCEPMGYLEGYKQQTKITNRGTALIGGIAGTGITGFILFFIADKW
jgi:hypothetical protein